MTRKRNWQAAFELALGPSGLEEAFPDGTSEYGRLMDVLRDTGSSGERKLAFKAALKLLDSGHSRSAEWWMGFAGLLDCIGGLLKPEREALTEKSLQHLPPDPEAKAYLYRSLAFLGCELAWKPILAAAQGSQDWLILADGAIWASEYALAKKFVERGLGLGVLTKTDVDAMEERWKRRSPEYCTFLRSSQGANSAISTSVDWDEFLPQERRHPKILVDA